jgi:opacity protein-like surface antigen
MKTFRLLTALLLTGLFLATAQADDSAQDGAWKQSAVIYLLAPTIRGTAGIGPADGDVDIDPKSVFDSLEGAFLGIYAAEKGRWGVLADVIYMDLGAELEGDREILSGKLNNKQFNLALAATYRLSEQWQVMGGGMYTDLSLKLDVRRPNQTVRRRTSESWIDPVVGARFATPLGEKWAFGSMALIGGFGVGSDLLWSLNASFSYSFSDRLHLMLGYRYIDFDYEDGAGRDRFRFDVVEHGPALGIRFDF